MKTIQLIQLYVLVCELYDTRRGTCFQRISNNIKPGGMTDQELVTIYCFAHLHGHFEKKARHQFSCDYWPEFFPTLPSYQTFVARLNRLEATFQSLGAQWQARLQLAHVPEVDHVIDSRPVMLARGGHAYSARVAREIAAVGYCASKKIYFHGVRLHTIAARRSGQLPRPGQIWLREGWGAHVRSLKEPAPELPTTTLVGDKAYRAAELESPLAEQETSLHTPRKKPKGQELWAIEKHYNRGVSRLRQPIESLFNWFNDKTDLQNAGTVRAEDALMIHCFGKLTVAYLILVFNP